jgi:hypothetical protein
MKRIQRMASLHQGSASPPRGSSSMMSPTPISSSSPIPPPTPGPPPVTTFTLTYTAGANGSIVGTSPQTVAYGANGSAVTASPAGGYHFVNWSDGLTANPRTDLNVSGNINVTANFAADPVGPHTLTYTAGANGAIVGASPQIVADGGNGTAVTANPDPGYQFRSWSDGSVVNPRTDTNVRADITVTANFTNILDQVLVVYNTSSPDSVDLKNYYVANRPGFAAVNTLGITVADTEIVSTASFETDIRLPIVTWLLAHPNQISYIIMLRGIPSRITGGLPSVDYKMSTAFSDMAIRTGTAYGNNIGGAYVPSLYPGTTALVTRLNMGSLAASKAYVDKLAAMYAAMAAPNIIISADNASLGGSHYYLDAAGHTYWLGNFIVELDEAALTAIGVLAGRITLIPYNGVHIASGADVMGYECWGANGGLGGDYALDGKVIFAGKSNWFLIKTCESYNGQNATWQGNFVDWFAANAFGGTAYSKTPVGATTHVEEPYTSGCASPYYLRDWESGMLFIEAAWDSRKTPYFMCLGDPLVKR